MDWRMRLKMYLRLNFLYQFLAIFTALIAVFMVGIHIGWPSVYIPELINGEPFSISRNEGSWIAIFPSFGAIIGAAVSTLANDCGRKPLILVTSLPYLISSILLAAGKSVLLLYVARVTVGIAIGITISVVPTYLTEIALEKMRKVLSPCVEIVMIFGLLFVNCLGEYIGNLLICVTLIALLTIFVIIFVLMPESPYFLMLNNKYNQARYSLTKFQGRDAVKHYYLLKAAVEAQNKGCFTDMFTMESNRKALGILCVVLSGRQLSADGAIDAYGQTIFSTVTDQMSPRLIAAIYYLSKILVVVGTSFLISKAKRKRILLVSFLGMGICSLFVGIHLYVKQYTNYHDPLLDYAAVGLLIIHGVCSSTVSLLPMILLSELFPTNITQYVSTFFGIYFFSSLCLTIKFFDFTSTAFGPDVSFFSYATSSVIHYILVYIFVFETAGKTLEEIQKQLGGEV